MSLTETGRMTDMSSTLNGWTEMPEAELVLTHCFTYKDAKAAGFKAEP